MAEKTSRLEVLRQFNQEGRGLAEGSQAVLKAMDDRLRSAPFGGPLVSQLDVDPKFIAAIEAALGRNLHAVVLKDRGSGRRNNFEGQPQKTRESRAVHPSTRRVRPAIRATKRFPKEALAWAVDKVVAPRQLEPLVRQLLGNIAIFSKLDAAIECKKSDPDARRGDLERRICFRGGNRFWRQQHDQIRFAAGAKGGDRDLEKEEASLVEQREACRKNGTKRKRR